MSNRQYMKKILYFAFILLWCMTASVRSAPQQPTLPVQVADKQWRPLLTNTDTNLQQALRQSLHAQGWSRLLKQRKFAVALVDLTNPARPQYAQINGNTMMYAASLPKIAILLAAADALANGSLHMDDAIDDDMRSMIHRSSNQAATRMIDRLGGLDRVNAVLTDPRFKFYDEANGGGLWVGKRYAKQGRRLPDPVNGISHGASANQVARFYYRMATGRLVSPAASTRMLDYMSDPGIGHKFVKSLQEDAPQAKLYRKSGTWRDWHSDSVLVWGPDWRRYILIGMVEDSAGEQILQQLVEVAERALQQANQDDL